MIEENKLNKLEMEQQFQNDFDEQQNLVQRSLFIELREVYEWFR